MFDIHQEAGQSNFITGSSLVEENVWDYPRPPALEDVPHRLRVAHAGAIIAETREAMRVVETSHPPVYYFPLSDVQRKFLYPAGGG